MDISLAGSRGVGRSAVPLRQVWRRRLVWILAAFAAWSGLDVTYHSATFPREVASNPVRVEAKVSDVYINGFGGDPGVDYRYRVAGRDYSGSGDGALGQENLPALHPGDPVAIEYARGSPSQSCTCNARSSQPAWVAHRDRPRARANGAARHPVGAQTHAPATTSPAGVAVPSGQRLLGRQ